MKENKVSEVELTVVIPTHNRREMLFQTLAGLAHQTYPSDCFEVVVMCDGDTDGTYEALKQLAVPYRLRVFEQPQSGVAAARNNAAAQASGRVILFIDDDITATPELLAEHMRLHEGHDDRVVIGRLLPDPGVEPAGWTRWEQQIFDSRYRMLESTEMPVDGRKFYSGNVSVARTAFVAAGGFNTGYRRAEDIELGYRLQKLGAQFVFNTRAAGIHRGVHSFEAWCRTQGNYGRYDVRLAQDEGHHDVIPLLAWFRQRNALNRLLARAAVGRPAVHRLLLFIAGAVAAASDRAGQLRFSRWSYSAIANLHYWQGVADELGGARQLWRLLRAQQTSGLPGGKRAQHV